MDNNHKDIEKIILEEQIKLINAILEIHISNNYIEHNDAISSELYDSIEFQKLIGILNGIKELTFSLSSGDLSKTTKSKSYIISCLKSLQTKLRHLSWQLNQLAQGDFSQRLDFFGQFSESFNQMIDSINTKNTYLQNMALIDVLTQVPNRRSLIHYTTDLFNTAKANGNEFCLFLIDIDNFKSVNDNYGHSAGDEILTQISSVLKNSFRTHDMFGRYGGEEFIAVMPNCPIDIAIKIANRSLENVRSTIFSTTEGFTIKATVSIGLTRIYLDTDTSYMDIINRADKALYLAKSTGRNRLEIANKESLNNNLSFEEKGND